MADRDPDPPVPLSRLRADLAAPRGSKRADALLAANDPAATVAALPMVELYQLIHDVGLEEAAELLALATPVQIRGFLDIDGWDRDRLQVEGIKPWLSALIEAGYDKLGQVWGALDPELAALVLARHARVVDLTLDDDAVADDDDRPVFQTPDTFFAVQLHEPDEDSARLIFRLVDDLYRADPSGTLARHTLMAARSEPPAELEEMSWRWRAGRMADLGYIDYTDALAIFQPLDPGAIAIGEGTQDRVGPDEMRDALEGSDEAAIQPGRLPIPVAEQVVGRSFLSRVLDRVRDSHEYERLAAALVVLVNKVLAAARVSPGDQDALAVGAEHATSTLALGLEHVAGGDEERAAEALRTISLTRLHRVGHTVTLPLARLARALQPRAVTAGDADAALLSALTRHRPFYPKFLDDPPRGRVGAGEASGAVTPVGEVRPFESRLDLARAAAALTRLALRIAIADGLGVDLLAAAEQPEPRPALDDHIRTALARVVAGDALEPAPLAAADLRAILARAFADGALTAEARALAGRALLTVLDTDAIASARDHLPALLAGWLDDLDEALGGLAAALARGEGEDGAADAAADATIDVRFVGGVITADT